jgi:hypothetical protein
MEDYLPPSSVEAMMNTWSYTSIPNVFKMLCLITHRKIVYL